MYKCVKGLAPSRLAPLFKLKAVQPDPANTRGNTHLHTLQLENPIDGSQTDLISRSIYGLIRYWNALPQGTINAKSVKNFQRSIQWHAKEAAKNGMSIEHICQLRFIMVPYDVLIKG